MLIAACDRLSHELAIEILRQGGIVALPTETVYGLAADVSQPQAIERVYRIKSRPRHHPLIVHIADLEQAARYAPEIRQRGEDLARAFWPGPLTLVLPKSQQVSDEVTGGHPSVALRMPDHDQTLAVIRGLGRGLVAPSANVFTRVSPTTAAHVASELGFEVDLILDGGDCAVGVESTVLDLSTEMPAILRPGAISAEEIERVIGRAVRPAGQASATPSPGQHPLHYSPRARIVPTNAEGLAAAIAEAQAAGQPVRVWCFDLPHSGRIEPIDYWLMPRDWNEIARRLYAGFRVADQDGIKTLIVELPPPIGLGVALRDRICRAAGISDSPAG